MSWFITVKNGDDGYQALVAENAVDPGTGLLTGPLRSADEAGARGVEVIASAKGLPVADLEIERIELWDAAKGTRSTSETSKNSTCSPSPSTADPEGNSIQLSKQGRRRLQRAKRRRERKFGAQTSG